MHPPTEEQIAAGELPPEIGQKRTLAASLDTCSRRWRRGTARSHRAYGEFVRYQIAPRLGALVLADYASMS